MRFSAKQFAASLIAIGVLSWMGPSLRGAGDCPTCGGGSSNGGGYLVPAESMASGCAGGTCRGSSVPTCDGGACGSYPGALGSGGLGCASSADRLFGRGQGCGSGGRVLDSLRNSLGTIGLTGCHSCCKGKCSGAVVHCGMAAPEYPVPFPTPKPTTWTELTYPPFMPHNSLPHYRSTYSFRHAPGLARTNVMWHPTKVQNALDRIHNVFEIPR